ncbi:MAG: DUF1800 family protein, partial [Nitrospina sp.]|nr:DUF1800 family protein [Nitrospina sp.]
MQVQLSELILVVAFVRRLILLSLCFVYLPVQALEAPAARHLLTRTGFEPRLVEIEDLQNSSHAESIEKLLHGLRKQPTVEPPAWVHAPPPNVRAMRKAPGNEKEAFRKRQRALGWELKSWWLREMIATPSPLTERMALFWHNHFASSLRKLKIPHPLYRQNELFRKHGTQNAADLLRALIRDPAVLVYLDNHRNVKRAPNENFARELLELFTLGEGHYQESDIKAAARAMSGYGIDKVSGKFKFRAKRHDNGVKVLFGQSGNFDGEAVVEILLAHPRTAEFWSEKLWFEFTGSVAPRQRVRALAQTLRSNNYAVAPWLRSL